METKKCLKCGKEKELKEFGKDKSRKDGFYCYCKECQKEYRNEYHINNPWKRVLKNIKERCNNISHDSYKNYGAKGSLAELRLMNLNSSGLEIRLIL